MGSTHLLCEGGSAFGTDIKLTQHGSDPVHGIIELGPICSLALETNPVQRLRNLKQLGPTCFGRFPSAEHSRYAHSLGVAHLARRSIQHLKDAGAEDVSGLDMELTSLAGLCHDLGHGPFSHSFDTCLERLQGPEYSWHHEVMSCQLLELVLEDAQIDLDSQQLCHVQDLINNSKGQLLRQPPQHSSSNAWRLQIVSNADNGLDVDKLDYLARDALMTGADIPGGPNFCDLLTEHCRVISGQICFDQDQQQCVAGVYDVRNMMFEAVYQHPQGKAAELMIADALAAAEPVLQIASALDSPREFLRLDDRLLYRIEAEACRQKAPHPGLLKAAALLQRLRTRQVYQLADEVQLPTSLADSSGSAQPKRKLTEELVVRCQLPGPVQLKAEDLRLQHLSIHYGLGDRDPLECVHLYDAATGHITKTACQGIHRPSTFKRNMVRVFITKPDATDLQAYRDAASAALRSAVELLTGWEVTGSSSSSMHLSNGSGGSSMQPDIAGAAAVDLRSAAAGLLRQRQAWLPNSSTLQQTCDMNGSTLEHHG